MQSSSFVRFLATTLFREVMRIDPWETCGRQLKMFTYEFEKTVASSTLLSYIPLIEAGRKVLLSEDLLV